LWNYDGNKIWEELFKDRFKVVLTKISCEGIDKEWLGKIMDNKGYDSEPLYELVRGKGEELYTLVRKMG